MAKPKPKPDAWTKDPEDVRTKRIIVRITAEEDAAFRSAARRLRKDSLSTWIRDALRHAAGMLPPE